MIAYHYPPHYNLREDGRRYWLAQSGSNAWADLFKAPQTKLQAFSGKGVQNPGHLRRFREEMAPRDIVFLYQGEPVKAVVGIARVAKRSRSASASDLCQFDRWLETAQVTWKQLSTDATLKKSEKVRIRVGTLFRLSEAEAQRLLELMALDEKGREFVRVQLELARGDAPAPSPSPVATAPQFHRSPLPVLVRPHPSPLVVAAAKAPMPVKSAPRVILEPARTPPAPLRAIPAVEFVTPLPSPSPLRPSMREQEAPYAARSVPKLPTPARTPETQAEAQPSIKGDMADHLAQQAGLATAVRVYREEGFVLMTDPPEDNPTAPWFKKGTLVVRVIVRGTRGDGASIRLTAEELAETVTARARSDLFVVHHIAIRADEARELRGVGGEVHRIVNWRPTGEALTPVAFDYAVPGLAKPVAAPFPPPSPQQPQHYPRPRATEL